MWRFCTKWITLTRQTFACIKPNFDFLSEFPVMCRFETETGLPLQNSPWCVLSTRSVTQLSGVTERSRSHLNAFVNSRPCVADVKRKAPVGHEINKSPHTKCGGSQGCKPVVFLSRFLYFPSLSTSLPVQNTWSTNASSAKNLWHPFLSTSVHRCVTKISPPHKQAAKQMLEKNSNIFRTNSMPFDASFLAVDWNKKGYCVLFSEIYQFSCCLSLQGLWPEKQHHTLHHLLVCGHQHVSAWTGRLDWQRVRPQDAGMHLESHPQP